MAKPVFWTPERISKALEMSAAGFSYEEIGACFGKTKGAVNDAMNRHRNGQKAFQYDKSGAGPAIGYTLEDARLRRDAIKGSAKLLAEIERVFGRAA